MRIEFTDAAIGEGSPAHLLNKLQGLTFDITLTNGRVLSGAEIFEARLNRDDDLELILGDGAREFISIDAIAELRYL
jgi:hypothetical protein